MRLGTILVISLLFLGCVITSDVPEGCKNVSISTQLLEDGEFAFDVMNRGELNPDWRYEDDTIKDSDSTEMDFLYVTVFGKHDKLTKKNFGIQTNSTAMTSNSTVFLEKVVDHNENKTYSIRINYKCNEDAAALIKLNFRVEQFPGCPIPSNIFWTRKCGDNEPPRMGLQVDYNIKHKFNHTIVENGLLVDADYFSEDYDSYVLRIPPRIQYSLFYVSLNVSEEVYAHNDLSLDEVEKLFKTTKQDNADVKLLVHQMQFLRYLDVKAVTLNYDVQVVDVVVKGSIINGGTITAARDAIYLEYKCRRGGVSGIQLTLEMDYFKNVNIFFEKECPLQPGEGSGMFGTIAFFILIFFIVIIFVTLYNVFALEIRGVKAVPFAVTVLTGLSNIPGVKGSSIGNSLYNLANPSYTNTLSNDTINTVSEQVSQEEREFKDSEFKIKNISEKDEESNLDDSTVAPNNAVQLGNYGSI